MLLRWLIPTVFEKRVLSSHRHAVKVSVIKHVFETKQEFVNLLAQNL